MTGDSNARAAHHRRQRRPALLAAAALLLLPTCGDTNESGPRDQGDQSDQEEINTRWEVWSQAEEQWRTMESVEDLIIVLSPGLESLADSVLNLELPDLPKRKLFAPKVAYRDLAEAAIPTPDRDLAARGVQRRSWPTADADASAASGELTLWRPFSGRAPLLRRRGLLDRQWRIPGRHRQRVRDPRPLQREGTLALRAAGLGAGDRPATVARSGTRPGRRKDGKDRLAHRGMADRAVRGARERFPSLRRGSR